jgi:hypothetical protein
MRLANRSTLLYLATTVSLSLAACGGGDDGGGGTPDATPSTDAPEVIVPEGDHYQYVVSRLELPDSINTQLKLDIDGTGPKNKLGAILAALAMNSGGSLDLQDSLDKSIRKGDITLLADFQTRDFASATKSGLRVYLGEIGSPAACADPAVETTCGKHLEGTGMFTIQAGAPTDSLVAGSVVGGRFTGGPGKLKLQLALEGSKIDLNLINAKAQIVASPTGIDGAEARSIVAGAITKEELDNNVIPAISTTIGSIVDRDCPGTVAPDCGCPAGSTGRVLAGLFDKMPADCAITTEEIKNSPFIKTLLGADLDLLPPAGVYDSLSVGVGVTAVKATYPQPQ